MRKVELEPKLYKKEYTDFYGIAQLVYENGNVTLYDCGNITAKITKGKLEIFVLHPTHLELDIIREFAWQHGIVEMSKRMQPKEMRDKYGVYNFEGRCA